MAYAVFIDIRKSPLIEIGIASDIRIIQNFDQFIQNGLIVDNLFEILDNRGRNINHNSRSRNRMPFGINLDFIEISIRSVCIRDQLRTRLRGFYDAPKINDLPNAILIKISQFIGIGIIAYLRQFTPCSQYPLRTIIVVNTRNHISNLRRIVHHHPRHML